jgi:type II secretory ATPase GspE/PulE/Tfp pilus assembly ATPase PilB-like protein
VYSNEEYLIELLKDAGYLSSQQIKDATRDRRGTESIIEGLIRAGAIPEEEVARTCANNASMEFVEAGRLSVPPSLVEMVPADVAKRYRVVPVGYDGTTLKLAVTDPFDFETLDALPHILPFPIEFACATPTALRQALVQYYGDIDKAVRAFEKDLGHMVSVESSDGGSDAEAGDAPIIRLCSQLLLEAFQVRASDIHVEPLDHTIRIRYRIDGVLQEVATHPRKLLSAIISRIKIMTGTMSIAEKRLPQDGRIQIKIGEKDIDLRVSTVPTNHGESVVMRILDKSGLTLGLPELGFFSDDQATFENLITLPDGILLVTGPTGSGKTTTLYACLNFINRPDRKIITVEDPVEYQMSGINQVQVKEEVGMTFAAALRSMLRQAPNIVMIGEIRDAETANIAINAALTGHLVFSTLHTNDAPSAIARLTDIGVKSFLIASAVRAVQAQRLVRRLCPKCKTPAELTDAEIRSLGLDATRTTGSEIMGPKGCDNCRGRGFRGRLGIFEIFRIDDEVRHMINQSLTTTQLRRRARELGMRTMREDGIRKVLAGVTTAAEVIETTMGDSD